MNLVANKSHRVNVTDLHVNTVAAISKVYAQGEAELNARVDQHMGSHQRMSVKKFIRSAIQLGWSRDAAVLAVDQAGELENTRFDLINGRLVRL